MKTNEPVDGPGTAPGATQSPETPSPALRVDPAAPHPQIAPQGLSWQVGSGVLINVQYGWRPVDYPDHPELWTRDGTLAFMQGMARTMGGTVRQRVWTCPGSTEVIP